MEEKHTDSDQTETTGSEAAFKLAQNLGKSFELNSGMSAVSFMTGNVSMN